MIVSTALRQINFKVKTIDDITNHNANDLFTNQAICDELNTQLNEYARITKGIEDIYSFPINTNTPFVAAPTYALRSEAYHYIGFISNGAIFGCDFRGMPEVYNTFRYSPMQGITNWFMPWAAGNTKYFSVFPMAGKSANSTTLTSDINASVTTIPVASTSGFVNNHGRITIGSEKILYAYKDSTNFYGCVRGVELTTAASHTSSTAVYENNVFMHYSRLAVPLTVESDGTFSSATQAIVLDPCEEHMQGIIKAVAYNLLIKLDPSRATRYETDANKLYGEYALDIMRGYYDGRAGANVRLPFPTNESGFAYGSNIIY